jgi:hypothetical protein
VSMTNKRLLLEAVWSLARVAVDGLAWANACDHSTALSCHTREGTYRDANSVFALIAPQALLRNFLEMRLLLSEYLTSSRYETRAMLASWQIGLARSI